MQSILQIGGVSAVILNSENEKPQISFSEITGQKGIKEVRKLFREYAESLETDLCFQRFQEELDSLPGKYAPPDGSLILAHVDGYTAGCIALRKLEDGICEMKRLYVRENFRGLGLGKKLVTRIIEEASRRHYQYMRLDTLPTMKEAQRLYLSFGFYDIESYVYNPVDGVRYMELKLTE
jgi:ribosomal protein S18 acetylase RimI-like enzyme